MTTAILFDTIDLAAEEAAATLQIIAGADDDFHADHRLLYDLLDLAEALNTAASLADRPHVRSFLARHTGPHSKRLHDLVAAYQPLAIPPGLTPAQEQTLRYLHAHGATTAAEMAEVFGLSSAAIYLRLRPLIDAGHVAACGTQTRASGAGMDPTLYHVNGKELAR